MRRILHETNAGSYVLFIGGAENYRYSIDPNYKANRSDKEKPMWLQQVREYLVTEWKAQIADGIETDDAVGIAYNNAFEDAVICSYDKDLRQIPGTHYNFKTGELSIVSPLEGWRNFYTQLVMGDKSDNIQGYDGKMRQTVPKFLMPVMDRIQSSSTVRDMYESVAEIYELGEDAMHRNAQLLYIQRKEGDSWAVPEE
jgi:DNA polymerase-1